MNLSARSLQILKNFSTINPSIQFSKGNSLRTISPNKTILAKAALNTESDSTFAIYDLSRFLGVLSLFKDPNLNVGEKHVTINEGGRRVNYTFADPSNIVLPPNKDIDISSLKNVVSFNISSDNLSEIMKALGVLGLPELVIAAEDGICYLRAMDSKNPSSDKYDIAVADVDANLEFSAIIKVENLKLLSDDYEVTVTNRIVYFKGSDVEYWIAIEDRSKV